MWDLVKAAVWKYIKLRIAETIFDIKKEIRKRESEDVDEDDKPKMEGGLHVTTDFEHPHMLGREGEIFGFGFTSGNRVITDRTRN
jgi:hypothetical protein